LSGDANHLALAGPAAKFYELAKKLNTGYRFGNLKLG
jgi:hypothetical protein